MSATCEYTYESGIAGTDGLVGDDGYVECGDPAVGVVMEPGFYGEMHRYSLCEKHLPRE